MIKLLAGYKTWPPTNQEGRWQNWRKIWPSASSLGLLVPLLLPCWLYILSLEFQAATLTRTLEPFAPFPGPPAPGLGVGSHCLSPVSSLGLTLDCSSRRTTELPDHSTNHHEDFTEDYLPSGPPTSIFYLPQGCTSTLGCQTRTTQLGLGMQAPILPTLHASYSHTPFRWNLSLFHVCFWWFLHIRGHISPASSTWGLEYVTGLSSLESIDIAQCNSQ